MKQKCCCKTARTAICGRTSKLVHFAVILRPIAAKMKRFAVTFLLQSNVTARRGSFAVTFLKNAVKNRRICRHALWRCPGSPQIIWQYVQSNKHAIVASAFSHTGSLTKYPDAGKPTSLCCRFQKKTHYSSNISGMIFPKRRICQQTYRTKRQVYKGLGLTYNGRVLGRSILGRSSGQGRSIPFWFPHKDLEL